MRYGPRNPFCRNYDDCLDRASGVNKSFSCLGCKFEHDYYSQQLRDPHDWAGCLRLIQTVFSKNGRRRSVKEKDKGGLSIMGLGSIEGASPQVDWEIEFMKTYLFWFGKFEKGFHSSKCKGSFLFDIGSSIISILKFFPIRYVLFKKWCIWIFLITTIFLPCPIKANSGGIIQEKSKFQNSLPMFIKSLENRDNVFMFDGRFFEYCKFSCERFSENFGSDINLCCLSLFLAKK